MVPLHKGGSKVDLNNYRPISLLPTPVKIFEKLACIKITGFLEQNNLFTAQQGGFRREKSTTETILKLLDYSYYHLNQRKPTHLIFYDLKKAFDTVDHQLLLNKFDKLHLSNIKPLINNYLRDRKQITLVNGSKSQEISINCGVPQGSILGPLLFLLFINDLPEVIKGSRIKLYADDAVMYFAHSNVKVTEKIQTRNNREIVNWCNRNKLTLNAKKTEAMWLTGNLKLETTNFPINIYEDAVNYVESFKYLGLHIDSKLNFTKHLSVLESKIVKQKFLLHRCRRFLTTNQSIFLFKSLVLPIFDYVDVFYGSGNKEQLDHLQVLQNNCLRSCYKRNRWPGIIKAHTENGLLFLEDRRTLHLAQQGQIESKNSSKLKKFTYNSRRSNKFILDIYRSRYKIVDKSTPHRIVSTWNSLPEFIRNFRIHKILTNILPSILWTLRLKKEKEPP